MSPRSDDSCLGHADLDLGNRIHAGLQQMLLKQCNTFDERQFAKQGRLRECTQSILLRMKRGQRIQWIAMVWCGILPLMWSLLATFSSSVRSNPTLIVVILAVPLIQIPAYVQMNTRQSRLKILTALVLLTSSQNTEAEDKQLDQELERLVLEDP